MLNLIALPVQFVDGDSDFTKLVALRSRTKPTDCFAKVQKPIPTIVIEH